MGQWGWSPATTLTQPCPELTPDSHTSYMLSSKMAQKAFDPIHGLLTLFQHSEALLLFHIHFGHCKKLSMLLWGLKKNNWNLKSSHFFPPEPLKKLKCNTPAQSSMVCWVLKHCWCHDWGYTVAHMATMLESGESTCIAHVSAWEIRSMRY